jgi:uncharacterized membrane protein YecN with MAPEG domain
MNSSLLPVITTFYASILGLMAAFLTIQVIVNRVRLLACVESIGGVPLIIHILGMLLIIARCLSAFGLSQSLDPSLPRQAGASLTILTIVITSFYGLTLSKEVIMRTLHL